jgi:lipopolysaccharide transport system ATP-binding protein
MEHVYKKFRKGEVYNSLRDFLPALTGRVFRQQNLSEKDSREFWALQDISFEVKRGEAVGIIGSNGAGKSTILKILSRIMNPTRGTMVVNGRLSAVIEVSAGFHQDLTGRENIYLNGTIMGMSKSEISGKLDRIIDFSGIGEFIDTPVKRYSSGMYARLGFSIAAHVDPDVLIVDEVLSVGDHAFQQRCIDRMKEVVAGGATALFVSHNLQSVTDFCQRCLLFERGRIIASGSAQSVVAEYLSSSRDRSVEHTGSKEITITKVAVRNQHGETVHFQSGQAAWIDIEVTAVTPCRKLSVSLYLTDPRDLMVMDTSTERLGHGTIDLEAGETFRCTFQLDLNLVGGTFYVSSLIFRYDIATEYDRWLRAATIFVSSDRDVRGLANCFPLVTAMHKLPAPDLTPQIAAAADGCVLG